MFRNACPFRTSVHPHGVFYEKDSEGAPYNDGTSVVTRSDMARPDGTPTDVDKEVFAEFFIDNETLSPLLATNERRFGAAPMPAPGEEDDDFIEST